MRNRTAEKLSPGRTHLFWAPWWLPGLLFEQLRGLRTGGRRKLLSVFIVISRSRMSSWANLLLLISLTGAKELAGLPCIKLLPPPFLPSQKTEHNVGSARGKYDKRHESAANPENAEVRAFASDVLYTSARRHQLLNQIGDNLCIFRSGAKLYNLRHLLHYAWNAPFWVHISIGAPYPWKCTWLLNIVPAVFGAGGGAWSKHKAPACACGLDSNTGVDKWVKLSEVQYLRVCSVSLALRKAIVH